MGKNYCKVEHKWCKFCKRKTCYWNNETPLIKIKRCPKRESTRTIRLKDYFADVELEDIMEGMCKYWPDQIKNINGYIKAFNTIKSLNANKSDWFISVKYFYEPERDTRWGKIDECKYLDVSGIAPNGRGGFAIEFTPWEEWLGMNITQDTLDSLPKNEILGGILYEMTWAGYEQEKIQEEHNQILEAFEECKKLNNK